jgi:FkbM family methyltransferase
MNWRRLPGLVNKLPRALLDQRREVRGLAESIPKLEARLEAVQRKVENQSATRVYVGNDRAWLRTEWGGKLIVDTNDLLMSPWLLLDGVWEPDVTEWFRSTLKPGMTFIDIGANVGYFSVLAAFLVGWGGRVIAFEAMPATYELLAKNVIVNWMTTFSTAENVALYSDSRRLKFYIRKYYHGNSSLAGISHEEGRLYDDIEEIEVEAISLDEYLCKNPARPDVIKVDVEGSELQVFKGARQTLASNPDVIVMCEWSQDQIRTAKDDPAELVEELRGHGFKAYRIDTGMKRISYEELLEVPYCNIVLNRS